MKSNLNHYSKFNQLTGEFSGAFADLGTFLPLVLGLVTLNHFSPQGIFIGFGLFALFTAFFYRKPIPVQPMKVIAALVIAQELSPGMLQASGIMMGIVLLLLAYSGAISWIAKHLSPAISIGIQLAIGLQLMWMGIQMMSDSWIVGMIAFSILLTSRFLPLPYLIMPTLLALSIIWQYNQEASSLAFSPVMQSTSHLLADLSWQLNWPTIDEWQLAAEILVLPQLGLTLTNAVIATSAMAKEKFPQTSINDNRFDPKRFAISSGWANLILTPFGATPMCHGAGGLAVQYHFGARTWVAPCIFGTSCLLIALFWSSGLATILALIPLAILGSLLAIAGIQLAWSKRFLDAKPFCIFVIFTTATLCLLVSITVGLFAGVILEIGRRQWSLFQLE